MQERLDAIERAELGEECFTAERIEVAARQRAGQLSPPTEPTATHPLQSGEISDAWIDQTVDVEDQRVRLEKQRGVLLTLANTAGNQARSIRAAAEQRILTRYHQELQQLLADVRAVSDELGTVTTAGEAIAADLGPAWKRLASLSEDYLDLRAAQLGRVDAQTKYETSPDFPGEPHASDLYLRNLDDLFPNWRLGGNDSNRFQMGGVNNSGRREPWPDDPSELLLWLVRSEAQPWIPTAADLNRLREERHARRNPPPAPPPVDQRSTRKPTKITLGA